jgi:hypothetical protein
MFNKLVGKLPKKAWKRKKENCLEKLLKETAYRYYCGGQNKQTKQYLF